MTNWINDTGDIAGKADLPGPLPQNHDAVLWTNNGKEMIDLGVLPGDSCANAYYVNSRGQVVGTSENSDLCRIPTGEHAFLWEKGGPMIDLNSLIPPDSGLELVVACAINNRGEIVGIGSLPNGDTHAFVLIPCGKGTEGCGDAAEGTTAVRQNNPAPDPKNSAGQRHPTPSGMAAWRAWLAQRYRIAGLGAPRD